MLIMDPPDHTRVRKLVNKAFTPKRIAALRGHIEEIVRELGDEALGQGPLRSDPRHRRAAARRRDRRAARRSRLGSPPVPRVVERADRGDRERRAPSRAGRATAAGQSLFGYLAETIAARRREPRDDLISAMIHAQEERDALSDAELLATSNLLLLAGHETTTNLIGNGTLALLREPDAVGAACAPIPGSCRSRSRSCCASTDRCRRPCASRSRTSRSTATPSRRARSSSSASAPRTTTPTSSSGRTSSTSRATRTPTWPSASAPTSVWAPRSRASRPRSPSRR